MTPEDAAKKKKADKKDRQRKKKALEKAERVRQEEEEHLKLERKAQKSRTPEPQDMESLRIRNAYRHLKFYARGRPLEQGKSYAIRYVPHDRTNDPPLLTGKVGKTMHQVKQHPTYEAHSFAIQHPDIGPVGSKKARYIASAFDPPKEYGKLSRFMGEINATPKEIERASQDVFISRKKLEGVYKKHYPDEVYERIRAGPSSSAPANMDDTANPELL